MIESKRLTMLVRTASIMLVFRVLAGAQFAPAPGSPVMAAPTPCCVAVGDFNEDGIPDIAVLSTSANTLTVLLGVGNGTFSLGASMSVGNAPRSMAVADFNGDGHLDLVVASGNPANGANLILLMGSGKGTFSPGATYSAGQSPSYVVAGDFNNDTHTDFAVTDQVGNNVLIFINDGHGNFPSSQTVPVGQGPFSIASGRFNGTSYMAVANRGDGTVSLLSYGSSGFQQVGSAIAVVVPNPNSLKPAPASVVLADFNGDGVPDIATANQGTNNISVLLSNTQGGYTPAPNSPFAAGAGTIFLVSSDFNNDGSLDLAAVNGTDSTLTVLLGNGQGGFTAAPGTQPSPGPSPFGMAVGDFDRNGTLDLAIADNGANTVTVLLNNFSSSLTMVSAASYTQPVAPGSLVSIYGTSLAAAPASASSTTPALPIDLGGVNVTLTDSTGASSPLSLLYVSPTLINALLPAGVAPGRARLTVFTGSSTILGGVSIVPVAPSIFTANQNGQGVAWAQFVNNIFQITDAFQCPGGSASAGPCIPAPLNVSPGNCPTGGCQLILYGTGLHNASSVSVMIAGQQIPAAYAGPSQYSGEDQVNVPLPSSLAGSGIVSVKLVAAGSSMGTVPSNIVTVYIQ